MNGPAPFLGVRDLEVAYGPRSALRVDALEVPRGETLSMIGPNGAGKSTLVRVLALLQRPERGRVYALGREVARPDLALRRRIACVFHEPLLLDRSLRANVELGLRYRGVGGAERRSRVDQWLDRFRIAHLAGRSARTLSGGEARRASLARAFVLAPEVLLLDEPFNGLDPEIRDRLLEDLGEILRDTGTTAVLTSHHRREATTLGRRVALLLAGELVQVGVPEEVFLRPATAEAARFIGIDNVLDGTVLERHGNGVRVDVGGARLLAAGGWDGRNEVCVCVRGTDVQVRRPGQAGQTGQASPPGEDPNRLQGRILKVVPAGMRTRLHLGCDGSSLVAVRVRDHRDEAWGQDETVEVRIDPAAVHLVARG